MYTTVYYTHACKDTQTQITYTSYCHTKTSNGSTETGAGNGVLITHRLCADFLSFRQKCLGRPGLVFAYFCTKLCLKDSNVGLWISAPSIAPRCLKAWALEKSLWNEFPLCIPWTSRKGRGGTNPAVVYNQKKKKYTINFFPLDMTNTTVWIWPGYTSFH